MAIKAKKKLRGRKIEIDLTGPQGNAFVLLGYAQSYAKDLGKDWPSIRERMMAGNYDNLVKVFDEEFGEYVDLYR